MSWKTSTPKPLDRRRQQRRRRDDADLRAHRVEQQDVGARDPAVQHVAADRDPAAPAMRPKRRRMVSASSSAWVGCS